MHQKHTLKRYSILGTFSGIIAAIVLFLFISFILTPQLFAQSGAVNIREKTTEGTEFWLCFQRNFKDTPSTPTSSKSSNDLFLELYITGSSDSKVSIEIDGLGFRREIKVAGGTVVNVKIDPVGKKVNLAV